MMNSIQPGPLARLIRARRRDLGMTVQQLADTAGCAKSYISAIETGARDRPPGEELISRIESALYLEAGSLVRQAQWESAPMPVREEFSRLLEISRLAREMISSLTRSGDDPVARKLRDMLGREQHQPWSGQPGLIPVLGPGDDPAELDGGPRDQVLPPVGPALFAMRLEDDTMAPEYLGGEVVVFSPDAPGTGEDGAVRLRDEPRTTFRRVFREDGGLVRLQPLNPRHAPVVVADRDVVQRYRAVMAMRPIVRVTRA